jgi:hypothetical protein
VRVAPQVADHLFGSAVWHKQPTACRTALGAFAL